MINNEAKYDKIILEKNKILQGLILFFVYFISLLPFLGNQQFIDEFDNFIGGMIVANGGDVYSQHMSQHMPMTYYLCAIYRLVGANSVTDYRLCFFITLSALWVAMYFRYYKHFGKIALIFYPMGYCIVMSYFLPMSATVLSDQLQAQGMVILLLEFLMFCKSKKLSIHSCCWISLSVLLSFGTTFVSLFGIFFIAIGVLVIEIFDCIKSKTKIQYFLPYLVKKYWKLIVITMAPFIVLIIWYGITDNLYNFYLGAYKINTTVYPEYLGMGDSPLKTILLCVDNYFQYFSSSITLLASDTMIALEQLVFIFTNMMFIVFIVRKNKICGVFTTAFFLVCATRGFVGFHSMAYYGVTIIMGMILISVLFEFKEIRHSKIKNYVLFLAVFIFITPYFSMFSAIDHSAKIAVQTQKPTDYAEIVMKLTNKDEQIHMANFSYNICIEADRLPIITSPSGTPWMYRMFGAREIEAINTKKPKVIIWSKDFETWGHKQADYAADLVDLIMRDYQWIGLEEFPDLYVRKDFFTRAEHILKIEKPLISGAGEQSKDIPITGESELSQVFTANAENITEVGVKIGTFARVNHSELKMSIVDIETKKVLAENIFNTSKLKDNKYNRLNLNCKLEIGKQYEVTITSKGTTNKDNVAIYRTEDGTSTENMYAQRLNQKQNYNLCIKIYGK